jgi:hypothetical protein
MLTSNKTLAKTIEDYLGKKFTDERAKKRPDLLLTDLSRDTLLLIEFKRPSHSLTRDDKNQAEKYRDDLLPLFSKKMDVLVIGGSRKQGLPVSFENGSTMLMSYVDIISSARNRLDWLIKELLGK